MSSAMSVDVASGRVVPGARLDRCDRAPMTAVCLAALRRARAVGPRARLTRMSETGRRSRLATRASTAPDPCRVPCVRRVGIPTRSQRVRQPTSAETVGGTRGAAPSEAMDLRRMVHAAAATALMLLLGLCGGGPGGSPWGGVLAARVLAVLPFPAKSHLISYTALTRGLAERGHNVTLVSAFAQEENHPNQEVIAIGDLMMSSVDPIDTSHYLELGTNSFLGRLVEMTDIWGLGALYSDLLLQRADLWRTLDGPGRGYDLVIVEAFFGQEALIALGNKYGAPVVALQPFGDAPYINLVVGSSVNPAYKPNPFLGYDDNMTFVDRVVNTVFTVAQVALERVYKVPAQQKLLDKYFPGSPPLQELCSQLALTIINSHHTFCYSSAVPPNVVMAGGMHIKDKPQQLPIELQAFMDGAVDGLVYFSMGSFLQASDMSAELKASFLEAFRGLKQRVLMKWNADAPENLPKNMRLEPWLPQNDVLRHPNTRVFISHGGLLGSQEAIYHGVPIIGIPRFGDQRFNMRLAKTKGYGFEVDYTNLTSGSITWAVKEMIGNPKYAQAAKRLSQLFRDQPRSPLDNAVFWVEHVIRHGADHLRPAAVLLQWYQLFLVDVALVLLLPVMLLWCCCRPLCRRSGPQRPQPRPAASAPASESKKRI